MSLIQADESAGSLTLVQALQDLKLGGFRKQVQLSEQDAQVEQAQVTCIDYIAARFSQTRSKNLTTQKSFAPRWRVFSCN
jgi:hypothetical protein